MPHTPPRPETWRMALGYVVGAIGISFAAIFVRLALPAPPVVTGFYRMFFASLLLGAWLGLVRRPKLAPPRASLWLATLAGCCFGTDLALWNTAIVETSVANATLFVNTTPIHVGLFSVLVMREKLGPRYVVGAVFALVGAGLLLGVDLERGGPSLRGDILAMCAALFYSAYLLLTKAARASVDTLPTLLATCVGASFALFVYAVLRGDAFFGFPAHSWAAMLGATVVSQLGGVLAIIWVLRYLRATFASLALLAQPVGTAILGWLILGEAIGPIQGLGGICVLAGIVLASKTGTDD